MVIKNLENKIKLVTIFCGFFLAGCVLISLSSIWTARMMVTDASTVITIFRLFEITEANASMVPERMSR